MKYRDPETGELKPVITGVSGDTLPIGSIVEFEGATVPSGWEETSSDYAKLSTTPQTSSGDTKITYLQLSYSDGWKLYVRAITAGAEHEFTANLTQLS